MSRKHMWQHWTEEECKAAIAKSLADEPDGPNTDYWTTDCTIQKVKAHYRLNEFKPDPVTVTLVRKCCGKQFVHVLKYKRESKRLKDFRCFDPQCRLKVVVMPFGKFKGQTLPWINERSSSYLAWFCETAWGCEDVKEAIMAIEGMDKLVAEYRKQMEELEWRKGPFSEPTVDAVCLKLFSGEEEVDQAHGTTGTSD